MLPPDGHVHTEWSCGAAALPRHAGRPLGRVDSIDRHLLRSWLDQT